MSTETGEATEAAPEVSDGPAEGLGNPIAEALSAIPDSAETEQAETAPDAEAEPEKPAPKGKKGAAIDFEALFAEEKLKTPEGLLAARDAALALGKKNNQKHVELSNREERLKANVAAFRADKEQTQALAGMMTADLRALRTGKPEAALQALGRLSGADPLKLLEEINVNFAGGGQKQESQQVQQLANQVQQLTRALQERDARDQHGRREQFIAQRKQELLTAASDPQSYPHLAALAKANPVRVREHIANYIIEQNSRGARIDDATAIGHIEAELADYHRSHGAPVAPRGEAGRETSAGSAKPESGQAPRPPGKTLNPSLAMQNGGGTRVLTPAEQSAALHANPEDILRDLGIPF